LQWSAKHREFPVGTYDIPKYVQRKAIAPTTPASSAPCPFRDAALLVGTLVDCVEELAEEVCVAELEDVEDAVLSEEVVFEAELEAEEADDEAELADEAELTDEAELAEDADAEEALFVAEAVVGSPVPVAPLTANAGEKL